MVEVSRNLDIVHKSLKTWVALYDAGALKDSIGVAKLTPDQLRIRFSQSIARSAKLVQHANE